MFHVALDADLIDHGPVCFMVVAAFIWHSDFLLPFYATWMTTFPDLRPVSA